MMLIKIIFGLLLIAKVHSDQNQRTHLGWEVTHPPFDTNIYEEILDPELCAKQREYLIHNDTFLMMTFIDAGLRVPRGILQGNFIDQGNYHQCLGIRKEIDDMVIDGKYCQIGITFSDLVRLGGTNELENINKIGDTIMNKSHLYERIRNNLEALDGIESYKLRTDAVNIDNVQFEVAVCIPKPCTIRQILPDLVGTELINFEEQFCRFKNDKPWAPSVYVAIVVFSIFGLMAIFGTTYDVWNTIIHNRDPKSLNTICLSFSVYTNSRRIITFNPVRGALECVDGIRAISMAWIVIGHVVSLSPRFVNNLEFFEWAMSPGSVWLTASPIGVDTFFLLSGLLVVYTTVGKLSHMRLLKNLHLFYLNRLLRMFPLLASTVLLQVGVFHYISDGPNWSSEAQLTLVCRRNWWSTLLYVQNYVAPMCLGHTWYLAIDMQLHILSPLILFWVLSGKKGLAWSALICGLLVSLTASTIYIFLNNFSGTFVRPVLSPEENQRYMRNYYFNTLTRCSPFFVGMCFGYLIHIWREKNIRLSKLLNYTLWIVNLTILFLAFYATNPMKNINFDNQTYDNFANSFMRPMWAFGLGWLILACAEGYGGPINWFLSLRIWKLPSRLSYGMYLLHFPIQYVIRSSSSMHSHFSVMYVFYVFCAQFMIYIIVSFVFIAVVDFPCSNLLKMVLGDGIKKTNSQQQNGKGDNGNQLVTNHEKSRNN